MRYGIPTGQFGARRTRSLTYMIVAVCVAFFIAVTILDFIHVADLKASYSLLGLSYPGVVHHHWFHQFLTAPFLHSSLMQLVFNMLALWMLGRDIERNLGRRNYSIFSIMCAGLPMAGFLIFSRGTGNIMLGYSGVIFGLLVAQSHYHSNTTISMFGFFPIKMKHAVLLIGAIELYLTISPDEGGMAHAANLIGGAAAFLYFKRKALFKILQRNKRLPPIAERHLPPSVEKALQPIAQKKAIAKKRGWDIPSEL